MSDNMMEIVSKVGEVDAEVANIVALSLRAVMWGDAYDREGEATDMADYLKRYKEVSANLDKALKKYKRKKSRKHLTNK